MKVKAKKNLNHKGVEHKTGDVFDVPDHEANNLIQSGHVEQHTQEEDAPGHSGSTPPPSTPPSSNPPKR